MVGNPYFTGLWKGCPSLRSNHEGTMAEQIPATFEMDWSADKPNVISGLLLEELGDHLSTYSGLPQ
jgi:hypothetical protein